MRTKRDFSRPDRLYSVLSRFISTSVPLSAEEERSLVLDPSLEARNRLILSQLPLVKSIAFGFNGYGIDVKDLFDQGVVGLIKAIDQYQPARGRLATYARHFILGEIRYYLNKQRTLVHLPSPLRRSVNQFRRVCRHLGEGATNDEIAAAMKCPTEAIGYFRECSEQTCESLDEPLSDSDEVLPLQDTLGSLDPGFTEVETKVSVTQLLSHLSEVEREVIRLRYGFVDGVERSLRAVGKQFGKSHEWVSQVEKTALAKMRKHRD